MKLHAIRSHLQDAGPKFHRSAASILSFAMFLLSMIAVVLGFIGYYSRVTLNSEFQQQGGNIDYIFMQVEQIERDETALQQRRKEQSDFEQNINGTLLNARAAAFASKEYKAYLDAASAVILILDTAMAIPILDKDYWAKVNKVDYNRPDLAQAQIFADPEFKPEASGDQRIQLYGKLSPALQEFRQTIVSFNAQYGNQINQ